MRRATADVDEAREPFAGEGVARDGKGGDVPAEDGSGSCGAVSNRRRWGRWRAPPPTAAGVERAAAERAA